jgi:hypothetical protein
VIAQSLREAIEVLDHIVELVQLATQLREHVALPNRGLEHAVLELACIELVIRGFEGVMKMSNEDIASFDQPMALEIPLGHERCTCISGAGFSSRTWRSRARERWRFCIATGIQPRVRGRISRRVAVCDFCDELRGLGDLDGELLHVEIGVRRSV